MINNKRSKVDKNTQNPAQCKTHLHLVRRVLNHRLVQEALLDSPHANKAAEQVSGASLVVGTGSASATERLLADDGAGALERLFFVPGSLFYFIIS